MSTRTLGQTCSRVLIRTKMRLLLNSHIIRMGGGASGRVRSLLMTGRAKLARCGTRFFISYANGTNVTAESNTQLLGANSGIRTNFYFLLNGISFCDCGCRFQGHPETATRVMERLICSNGCPLLGRSRFRGRLVRSSVIGFETNSICRVSPTRPSSCSGKLIHKETVTRRILRTLGRCFPRAFTTTILVGDNARLRLPILSHVVKSCVCAGRSFGLHGSFSSRVKYEVPCHVLAPMKLQGLLITKRTISTSTSVYRSLKAVPTYLIANRTTNVTTKLLLGAGAGSMRTVSVSLLQRELGRRKRGVWGRGGEGCVHLTLVVKALLDIAAIYTGDNGAPLCGGPSFPIRRQIRSLLDQVDLRRGIKRVYRCMKVRRVGGARLECGKGIKGGSSTGTACGALSVSKLRGLARRKLINSCLRIISTSRTGCLRALTVGDHLRVPLLVNVSTVRKGNLYRKTAVCPAPVKRTSAFGPRLIGGTTHRATLRVETAKTR